MGEPAKDLHSEEEPEVQAQEAIHDPKHKGATVLPFVKQGSEKGKSEDDLIFDYFKDPESLEEGIFKIISARAKGNLSGTALQSLVYSHLNLFPPLEYFLKHGNKIVTPEAAQELLKGINSPEELKNNPLFNEIITDPTVIARFEKTSRNEYYKLGIPEEVKKLQEERGMIGNIRATIRRLLLRETKKAA